ncbi:hypothetical protein LRS11_20620 [Pseudomonas sp. J452]|uniref:hypothetical protein n=1 Tax=Pseudomonas sp. J452 TaxID=2898441 RepID=UPI0021AE19B4|nr:hypothetical protein [Pseudomonas sp. J452]UUY08174.1 hypothetical protein LRS11_20620 [Pseudomonas sp. J452]
MNKALWLPLLWLAAPLALADCAYQPLAIEPRGAEYAALYGGAGERVQVEFHNFKREGEVDSFPEPPMVLRQGPASCSVEGGIWLRRAVFLDRREQRLLVQSFSGSSSELLVYDTRTCTELARLELPEASWALEGDSLVLGRQCSAGELSSCAQRQVLPLNEQCLPSIP